MSVETDLIAPAPAQTGACSAITLEIKPKEHDLGGFSVRRALPSGRQRMVGPWIFFDHIGPADFPPAQGIDVRPHPHINLATVTYLFAGEMYHRDSLGNKLPISPGEINLMVAGKGIVHSERQRDHIKARDNHLHGLQLWMALPESAEEIDPEFHHYASSDIPQLSINAVDVRVLIGSAYNVTSPVKTFTPTLYVEANIRAGETLAAPQTVEERALYVVSGRINVDNSLIQENTMAILRPRHDTHLCAQSDAHIVIIGGAPMSHRYIWWNFVSSKQQRIEQAKQDWLSGGFGSIPGDDIEFIPLPEN